MKSASYSHRICNVFFNPHNFLLLHTCINFLLQADMCIVLGSSLRVRPACQIPEVVQAGGGKVVICK